MLLRTLLVILLMTLVAATAFAQPSTGWSDQSGINLLLVADFESAPGLDALHWDTVTDGRVPANILSVSMADFSPLGSLPRQFKPDYTTLYAANLNASRLASVLILEKDQQTATTAVGAYDHSGGTWVELWYNNLDFSIDATDLHVIALNQGNPPYVLETGAYLRLHDSGTGALLWASDDPQLGGPGPDFSLVNWTLADYNGDGLGNELLVELVNNSSAIHSLWMVTDTPAATAAPTVRGTRIALGQNRPNPMFGETTIRFALPDAAPVHLRVYDVRGRAVATIAQRTMSAGEHMLHWNGRDDAGNRVAQGMYFYELTVGGQRFTRKMMVVR